MRIRRRSFIKKISTSMLKIKQKIKSILKYIEMQYILSRFWLHKKNNYLIFVKLLQCFSLLGLTIFIIEIIDTLYEKIKNIESIPIQKDNLVKEIEVMENTIQKNTQHTWMEYVYEHKKEIALTIVGLVIVFGDFAYLWNHWDNTSTHSNDANKDVLSTEVSNTNNETQEVPPQTVDLDKIDVRKDCPEKEFIRQSAVQASENYMKEKEGTFNWTQDQKKDCASLSADAFIVELETQKNPVNYYGGYKLLGELIEGITDYCISITVDNERFLQEVNQSMREHKIE